MGKAVAQLLAKKGANVVIVARTVHKLEAALKEIQVLSKIFCSWKLAERSRSLQSIPLRSDFIISPPTYPLHRKPSEL